MHLWIQFWSLIILSNLMTLAKEPTWHVIYLITAMGTLLFIIFGKESK